MIKYFKISWIINIIAYLLISFVIWDIAWLYKLFLQLSKYSFEERFLIIIGVIFKEFITFIVYLASLIDNKTI